MDAIGELPSNKFSLPPPDLLKTSCDLDSLENRSAESSVAVHCIFLTLQLQLREGRREYQKQNEKSTVETARTRSSGMCSSG